MNRRQTTKLVALATFFLTAGLSADEILLKLEKSTDLQNWEVVPVTPEFINERGQLRLEAHGSSEAYRLVIRDRPQHDQFGVNFVYFTSFQAGSFTEIDDLELEDINSGKVVIADDFSTRVSSRWTFKHVRDINDTSALIDTNSSLTRIAGALQLECVGYLQNGSGGYDSASTALLNMQLPSNFSLRFRAKRNQWPGHFNITFAPNAEAVITTHNVVPNFYAYYLHWEGSVFGRTIKFNNDEMILVRGHQNNLSTGTNEWHNFEVRKEGSIVQVFVNGTLRHSDNLSHFNYSLIED
jgi:hypothetical protein